MNNKTLHASFTPTEVGDHKVEIFLNGKHIEGSPFTLKIGVLQTSPTIIGIYDNFNHQMINDDKTFFSSFPPLKFFYTQNFELGQAYIYNMGEN
jgi:hypothetical protein